ncbi:hypothetical protein F751_0708 [Auxenochlorella protothecoides]|uniref:G-patch domain-containing protein n=1 Tax=Auxenochlorella protothecoides TaxID=3075 RepID=A0A087SM22_AUXPR|nr:hypothetical protein F751_0708 [Auxenochlorella protothecoides]KFM26776.1 hypothetical protein F751_0708 [Auxenochlorella protothecoides]
MAGPGGMEAVRAQLLRFRVPELQEVAERLRLDKRGRKAQLQSRLLAYLGLEEGVDGPAPTLEQWKLETAIRTPDTYMAEVLAAVSRFPDIEEVELGADGRWRPVGRACGPFDIGDGVEGAAAAIAGAASGMPAGSARVKAEADAAEGAPGSGGDDGAASLAVDSETDEEEELRAAAAAVKNLARPQKRAAPEVIDLLDSSDDEMAAARAPRPVPPATANARAPPPSPPTMESSGSGASRYQQPSAPSGASTSLRPLSHAAPAPPHSRVLGSVEAGQQQGDPPGSCLQPTSGFTLASGGGDGSSGFLPPRSLAAPAGNPVCTPPLPLAPPNEVTLPVPRQVGASRLRLPPQPPHHLPDHLLDAAAGAQLSPSTRAAANAAREAAAASRAFGAVPMHGLGPPDWAGLQASGYDACMAPASGALPTWDPFQALARGKKKLVHGGRSQAWLDRQDSDTRLIMEDLLENSAFEDIVKPSTSEGGYSSNISYKADLSMETTEAKRAARSMARGFDLAAVDAYFRHAVETGLERGDLPGVKRLELCQVRALASLYGLEIGGSPSQPAFAATPRTVLPAGRAAAAAEIMLHQFSLRARFGAALLLAEGKATGKEKAGRRDSRESVVNRFAEVYARELGLRAPRWDEELVGERAVAARRLAAELGRGRPGAEEAVQALVERGEVIAVGKKAAKKKKAAGKHPSIPPAGLAAKPMVRFVSAGTLLDNGPSILQPLKPATWEDGAGEAAQAHPDSGASKARLVLDARLAGGEGLAAELLPVLEDTAGGGGEGSAPLYHSTARGLALRRAAAVAAVTAPMQQLSLGLTKGPGLVTLAGSDEEVSALLALQPMMTKQEAKAARKKAARKEKLALEGRAAAGLPPPPKAPQHGGGARIEAIPLPPRKDKQKVAKNMGYGQFERHTTGIGSKLLSKWGFAGEGAGLGKDGVGLTEPLLVSQRARQRGLGA